MKTLVVYNGGAAGDLISAILDIHGAQLTSKGTVLHKSDRTKLKKPHLFTSDFDKDIYLAETFCRYNSVPSHDTQYHIGRKHEFLGIVVNTLETAKWAATRFRKLHQEHVWKEAQSAVGIIDVDGYAQMMLDFSNLVVNNTKNVLSLEDILQGKAIDILSDTIDIDISGKDFYQQWLLHNTH
jgi:hypothetical protein